MYTLPTLQQLLEAGVHFGHQTRRGNPKMRPFIFGAREGVHIIDLTKSMLLLEEACQFVHDLGKNGGILLFVGTKKQARPIVEELAKKVEMPYLKERWIGGFLTNFDEILKNIKKLKDLKSQKEKGELGKYTKKEQLLISRKILKLEKDFKGVVDLETVPDAIFIFDTVYEHTAVKEAKDRRIKTVAIADSNSDPSLIDYPVPGNDDAIKSIKLLAQTLTAAFEEGRKQFVKMKVSDKSEQKEEIEVTVAEDEVAAVEEEIEKKEVKESERVV